uniref:CCHC-type domain-containing protein n=1 Tax=Brassica campestris TaxID=3711 RepID=M4CRI1_BRACM
MLTHKPRLDPTLMGEAKILVEVELDKPFPKLIALDDKQGNIFLVEVEYSWIPTACDRCGALGHKEKRCLQPPNPRDAAPVTKEPLDSNEEIPVVDIVTLVQNSANTLVDHLNRKSCSPSAHQAHETLGESSIATPSEVAIATPFTKSHEVHSTSCSEIDVTIPTLAAASVALSYSPIMEVIPSQSIISEDPESFVNDQQIVHTAQPTHIPEQFYRESETPITYGKGSGFEVVGASSSYNTTRGGRAIKPTQKLQEMEWTNVGGRGKKGRRGRGYNNH